MISYFHIFIFSLLFFYIFQSKASSCLNWKWFMLQKMKFKIEWNDEEWNKMVQIKYQTLWEWCIIHNCGMSFFCDLWTPSNSEVCDLMSECFLCWQLCSQLTSCLSSIRISLGLLLEIHLQSKSLLSLRIDYRWNYSRNHRLMLHRNNKVLALASVFAKFPFHLLFQSVKLVQKIFLIQTLPMLLYRPLRILLPMILLHLPKSSQNYQFFKWWSRFRNRQRPKVRWFIFGIA